MQDKFISAALVAVFLMLQYRVWVGDGSIAHVQQLHRDIDLQRQLNEQYRSRNDQIEREIVSLKSDPAAIEQRARRELGMIKPDETFFVFMAEEPAVAAAEKSN